MTIAKQIVQRTHWPWRSGLLAEDLLGRPCVARGGLGWERGRLWLRHAVGRAGLAAGDTGVIGLILRRRYGVSDDGPTRGAARVRVSSAKRNSRCYVILRTTHSAGKTDLLSPTQ